MKLYVAISIDVEPDCSSDWTYSDPLTFIGVTKGIGEILHPLFEKYNMAPTYLLNNVVIEDRSSVECLKNLQGNFELGTHLHPEFIEPEKQFHDYAGKSARANCCFYAPAVEKEKLKNISQLFENAFGYKPTSFRAGRFSAGLNTIATLKELGYKVDTSVSPHVKWGGPTRQKPVDYTKAPEQPYFMKEDSMIEKGEKGGLLQVPVTIGMMKRNFLRSILSAIRKLNPRPKFYKRVWLRPSFSSVSEMKQLVQSYMKRYSNCDTLVLNIMFHNVEVLPGLSPYAITQEECNKYLAKLHEFFAFCNENNIEGITLSDIYEVYANNSAFGKQQIIQLNDNKKAAVTAVRNVG
jgi:hypothetical protein